MSLVALLVPLACAPNEIVKASQVTFQFDATVARVIESKGGAALPFTVSAGDPLVTTFTFEPAAGGSSYPQTGVLRFELSGQELTISGYEISVQNDNFPIGVPQRGRIADPLNTPIVDQGPGSSDSIVLTCLHSGPDYCGTVPAHSELSYSPTVGFAEEAHLLSSEDLIADLEAWNSFSFREMSLSFLNTNEGRTYIGAFIGSVHAIPEPTNGCFALLIATFLAAWTARLR